MALQNIFKKFFSSTGANVGRTDKEVLEASNIDLRNMHFAAACELNRKGSYTGSREIQSIVLITNEKLVLVPYDSALERFEFAIKTVSVVEPKYSDLHFKVLDTAAATQGGRFEIEPLYGHKVDPATMVESWDKTQAKAFFDLLILKGANKIDRNEL